MAQPNRLMALEPVISAPSTDHRVHDQGGGDQDRGKGNDNPEGHQHFPFVIHTVSCPLDFAVRAATVIGDGIRTLFGRLPVST